MQTDQTLIIDGQVFQTPAWHRGMGKYSIELLSSIDELNIKTSHWSRIDLVLSEKRETEKSVLDALSKKCPNINVVWLNLLPNEFDNKIPAESNRQTMNGYIRGKKGNSNVDFLILSLMQSEIAPAFPSLDSVRKHLLVYDLIPLMFHKTYLTNEPDRMSYLTKLAEFLRADTYLTISQTVANDLSVVMGIDEADITSIDGASIKHAKKQRVLKIPRPFILMPTGNDLRKNNKKGIEGFAAFNKRHDNKYVLVVTSSFKDHEIAELQKVCEKVIFTGNIDGEQLEYLYSETSALLFPTEYEGLGLPILEALDKSKPVACSDISVFREISDTVFFYFNPRDVQEMADAIDAAVSAKRLPLDEYGRVLKKFTWQRTAELFLDSARKRASRKRAKSTVDLFYSPSQSVEGIAYVQRLYSEMSRLANVRVYGGGVSRSNDGGSYLKYIANTVDTEGPLSPNALSELHPVYFLTTDSGSVATLITALVRPGVLFLQDLNLKTLWTHAVNAGLVDSTRLTLEEEISHTYGDGNLLLSLICRQKTIVVTSKKDLQYVDTLLSSCEMNKTPDLICLPRASVRMVYDTLPFSGDGLDYPPVSNFSGTTSFRDLAEVVCNKLQKEETQ